MAEQEDLLARARASVLGGKVRIEAFEHEGINYAVRQSNTKMSRKAEGKKSAYDRLMIAVAESLHLAIPVLDASGKQATDTHDEPVMVPALDDNGMPEVEPVLDSSGHPLVIDGKPLMRARMEQAKDVDGNPMTRTVVTPRFEMGARVFGPEHMETLTEAPNDDESLVGKAIKAVSDVNDKERAKARAKKL
jgi:hypothetical protein